MFLKKESLYFDARHHRHFSNFYERTWSLLGFGENECWAKEASVKYKRIYALVGARGAPKGVLGVENPPF